MKPSFVCVFLSLTLASACATTPKKPSEQPVEPVVTPTPVAPVVQPAPAPAPPVAVDACPGARVHFRFDEALVRAEDLATLDQVARCLRRNTSRQVVIEGNADERGTTEYNLVLSGKRAASVERYLRDFGVSNAQMDSVSYGDERPLCTEHDESCWAQNRRVALNPQ